MITLLLYHVRIIISCIGAIVGAPDTVWIRYCFVFYHWKSAHGWARLRRVITPYHDTLPLNASDQYLCSFYFPTQFKQDFDLSTHSSSCQTHRWLLSAWWKVCDSFFVYSLNSLNSLMHQPERCPDTNSFRYWANWKEQRLGHLSLDFLFSNLLTLIYLFLFMFIFTAVRRFFLT